MTGAEAPAKAGDTLRRYVQHYLKGCCNETAEELWVLAHGRAAELEMTAEDQIIAAICQAFLRVKGMPGTKA
jgi:hypothetical protein